jgi:hypothetical protein
MPISPLDMLIQKERPRRMAVKLWARQIQGTASSNLSISVFPQCLDVPNSTFPNQLTIGDWIKSVIAYERVEEYEITAQLLNDMREFTMSMQLKHTPEFKALHFLSEFFKKEIEKHASSYMDGLFDCDEMAHATKAEDDLT